MSQNPTDIITHLTVFHLRIDGKVRGPLTQRDVFAAFDADTISCETLAIISSAVPTSDLRHWNPLRHFFPRLLAQQKGVPDPDPPATPNPQGPPPPETPPRPPQDLRPQMPTLSAAELESLRREIRFQLREELTPGIRAELTEELREELGSEMRRKLESEKGRLLKAFREGLLLEHVRTHELNAARTYVFSEVAAKWESNQPASPAQDDAKLRDLWHREQTKQRERITRELTLKLEKELVPAVSRQLAVQLKPEVQARLLVELTPGMEERLLRIETQQREHITRALTLKLEKELVPSVSRQLAVELEPEVRADLIRKMSPRIQHSLLNELQTPLLLTKEGTLEGTVGEILHRNMKRISAELKESIIDEIWETSTTAIFEALAGVFTHDDQFTQEHWQHYVSEARRLIDDRIQKVDPARRPPLRLPDGVYRAVRRKRCSRTGEWIFPGDYYLVLEKSPILLPLTEELAQTLVAETGGGKDQG